MAGLLAGQAIRQRAHGRRIAAAAADGARGRAAAFDGRADRHDRWQAAAASARRFQARGYRLRTADRERASEVRVAAGRPLLGRTYHAAVSGSEPRSHGADAHEHGRAARAERRRAGSYRFDRGSREPHGREISIPADFSSAAFFIVAGCIGAPDGLLIKNVGIEPDSHGPAHDPARDGCRHRARRHSAGSAPSPSRISSFVRASCTASTCPGGSWRLRSTSSRSCS